MPQTRLEQRTHQPRCADFEPLRKPVRSPRSFGGHVAFGWRRATDDRARQDPAPEVPSATRCVRTAAGPAEDPELFEIQVIGEFADVGRGPFICATKIERAVAVARTIKCDQSDAFAGGNVCDGSEVAMRTRRAMKSDDGRAIARAELAPREIAAVRKLEHSEIMHRARLPVPGSPRSPQSRPQRRGSQRSAGAQNRRYEWVIRGVGARTALRRYTCR